jgi:hypothetical protein
MAAYGIHGTNGKSERNSGLLCYRYSGTLQFGKGMRSKGMPIF